MCNAIDKPKIGTKQDLSGSTIVRVGKYLCTEIDQFD